MPRIHVIDHPSPLREVLTEHLCALGYEAQAGQEVEVCASCHDATHPCLLIVGQSALVAAGLTEHPRAPNTQLPTIVMVDPGSEEVVAMPFGLRLLGSLTRPFPLSVLEWLLRTWQRALPPAGASDPEASLNNRRRSLRVPCCKSATLLWSGDKGSLTHGVVLRDISLHGAGLRMVGQGSLPSESVQVLLPLPGRRLLRISGRAVRSEGSSRGRALGVEWGAMTPSQRNSLAQLFV